MKTTLIVTLDPPIAGSDTGYWGPGTAVFLAKEPGIKDTFEVKGGMFNYENGGHLTCSIDNALQFNNAADAFTWLDEHKPIGRYLPVEAFIN